jgi:hypothetical protein
MSDMNFRIFPQIGKEEITNTELCPPRRYREAYGLQDPLHEGAACALI